MLFFILRQKYKKNDERQKKIALKFNVEARKMSKIENFNVTLQSEIINNNKILVK